jgi:serine/threonine protein kinase
LQFVARKVIRAYVGKVTEEDIANEARAIDKLCKAGHINIIHVFDHKRFDRNSVWYCIDMELCDLDLSEYITGNKKDIKGLINWADAIEEDQAQFLLVAILQQLLNGLAFIHGKGLVHRDLTPKNGIFHICVSEK